MASQNRLFVGSQAVSKPHTDHGASPCQNLIGFLNRFIYCHITIFFHFLFLIVSDILSDGLRSTCEETTCHRSRGSVGIGNCWCTRLPITLMQHTTGTWTRPQLRYRSRWVIKKQLSSSPFLMLISMDWWRKAQTIAIVSIWNGFTFVQQLECPGRWCWLSLSNQFLRIQGRRYAA